MSADVSSDGRYVVTAHRDNQFFIWDLEEREYQHVDDDANLYSAYFIPESDQFVWQDLGKTVHVQYAEGTLVKSFDLPADTYGHVMTGTEGDYYYSDIGWGIYRRTPDGQITTIKEPLNEAFIGYRTILNLNVVPEKNLLLSVGDGLRGYGTHESYDIENQRRKGYEELNGLTLWDLETGNPISKLDGNSVKTHATISPDGQWVVSGDENGIGLYWNTSEPGNRHRLASYHSGIFIDDTPYESGDPRNRDTSHLIEAPSGARDTTIAQAFIHNSDYYLRFGNNSHIAALFKTGSPWPVKYFDLGESPELVTYGSQYSRNTAIATSPEAGILVMGHRSGGGISVYKFDPDALTLERTWVVE